MFPHSGMAIPTGPHPASTSTEEGVTSSEGSSIRLRISSYEWNTTAGPRCRSKEGLAAAALITAPEGARLPCTTMNAGSDVTGSPTGHRAGPVPQTTSDSPSEPPAAVGTERSSSEPRAASTVGTPPAAARSGISPVPIGATSTITGTRAETEPKSRSGRMRPRRPATAHRWMIAFVEPPTAASTVIALAKPAGAIKTEGRTDERTMDTIRCPAASASSDCRGSPEASTADPGSASPSVSAMIAIVDAVPIVLHAPRPWPRQFSSLAHAASSSAPPRRESYSRHKAVPLPSGEPSNKAGTRNPPVTTSPGMSALASAIR